MPPIGIGPLLFSLVRRATEIDRRETAIDHPAHQRKPQEGGGAQLTVTGCVAGLEVEVAASMNAAKIVRDRLTLEHQDLKMQLTGGGGAAAPLTIERFLSG